MQWYAAFGLMLLLIWIYVYVLRLIATSIQRVGDARKQAAMSSRKGENNRDNG